MMLCWRSKMRWKVLCGVLCSVTVSLYWMLSGPVSPEWTLPKHATFVARKGDISGGFNRQTNQACVHPTLELWHPLLKDYFKKPSPLQCDQESSNWVDIRNGTFLLNRRASLAHGKVECGFTPVIRGGDDFKISDGDRIILKNGDPVPSDFGTVDCQGLDGTTYKNVHSTVSHKPEVQRRHLENPRPEDSMGLNVLMFGFDSVSRMTWLRNLPKSHAYFMNELGGHLLEGYNIVGDGTPQALLPILTGLTEPELPEARRGYAGAGTVDGHPWIWKQMVAAGYATQWGEDSPGAGTFTYRMLGFKKPPVDHYMRPFYQKTEPWFFQSRPYCLGSLPRHLNMLNWAKDFYDMYTNKPKFSFVFHAEYTHGTNSMLQLADEDLYKFLKDLKSSVHFNNTLLILMSDHGARFQDLRQTVQGKYEERMPYFGLRFPDNFRNKYPKAYANFLQNTARLTTPFDIHETFEDILQYDVNKKIGKDDRGISLFREIPLSRTCDSAGIEAHWCACLNWVTLPVTDSLAKKAAQHLVGAINSFSKEQRSLCHELRLGNITAASKYSPNSDLLKFKKSADHHGRKPDLSDNMQSYETFIQITVHTMPNGALYEATVKYYSKSNSFLVDEKEISRINRYGDHPACIASKLPHLRPYCYCKNTSS